jgi:hypothetical protein
MQIDVSKLPAKSFLQCTWVLQPSRGTCTLRLAAHEHVLDKDGVGSSVLLSSTIITLTFSKYNNPLASVFCSQQSYSNHAAELCGAALPPVSCPMFSSCSSMGRCPKPIPCRPWTPEWTITLALRSVLRRDLGPKHAYYLPSIIAGEIANALRVAKWRLAKEPPNPPRSTPSE